MLVAVPMDHGPDWSRLSTSRLGLAEFWPYFGGGHSALQCPSPAICDGSLSARLTSFTCFVTLGAATDNDALLWQKKKSENFHFQHEILKFWKIVQIIGDRCTVSPMASLGRIYS